MAVGRMLPELCRLSQGGIFARIMQDFWSCEEMTRMNFRIWDTENKCWFKPTYEANKGKLEELLLTQSGCLVRRNTGAVLEHESEFPERYVLQWGAVLRDGHGDMIFEGDIIEGVLGLKGVVKFGKHVISGDSRTPDYHVYGFYCDDENLTQLMMIGFCEIIGNVLDNPEMVEGKT